MNKNQFIQEACAIITEWSKREEWGMMYEVADKVADHYDPARGTVKTFLIRCWRNQRTNEARRARLYPKVLSGYRDRRRAAEEFSPTVVRIDESKLKGEEIAVLRMKAAGLSYKQMAESTGATLPSVRMRLNKAFTKVRQQHEQA